MGTGSKKKTVSWCTMDVSEGTRIQDLQVQPQQGHRRRQVHPVGHLRRRRPHLGHPPLPRRIHHHSKDYVSVYLELMSENAMAMAFYTLSLVDKITGAPGYRWSRSSPRLFNSSDSSRFGPRSPRFILRSELEMEESGYILNDRLTVECEITVTKGPQVSRTMGCSEIRVPPSELSDHFGKLLDKEEIWRDVAFSVGGEIFAAHKLVLAARSLVFKAELYGPMRERGTKRIAIKDMQPAVFRALLHFIYTDALPNMGDLKGDDYVEMVRHLLVAADRYAMDRLRLMCQSILGKYVDVKNVATTLALADQLNCDRLKDICIEFISSLDEIDAMVTTKGYANLKRSCPSALADLFEKTSKFRAS